MSKITEYINLFLKGIPNSMEIANSVVTNVQLRYGNLPDEEKTEIIRRRLICATCPLMSENAKTSEEYRKLVGKSYETSRRTQHCAMCGCGIDMKTSSLISDCGLLDWNKKNPERQVTLKWTKFKEDGK
jgi:hypothetical protein